MASNNGIAPRRRGRPEDPRITELDNLLVAIVEKHGRITCRGAFYQAVNLKAVEKTFPATKLVERELLKLRRNGRIPYENVVDESRIVYGNQRYRGLADLAEAAAELYRRDYWATSECSVQIWVEKRGLGGLLRPVVCTKWGLDLYVAAGQFSETYLYTAGNDIALDGRKTFVYAMTDFDPGGATIFDTLKNGSKKAPGGISRFTNGVPVVVKQIALTASQVKAWKLPTRPAKMDDTRSGKFVEKHGDVSTELDAIEPKRLLRLVDDAISQQFPVRLLNRLKIVEDAERDTLRAVLSGLDYQDENDEHETN